ncbi:hypothetical protein AXG93_673s1090 [Marchantia polymorpha subsp. ruderalis]|uniref:Uncharacterized protein n=1 Tax=Marchantia polymorpha subsp. ruderalis TaxID=1480154 RepID=A0A176WKT7_MARPO|nr:hypothetical protein AXG93_673s1090 [Marchantia polymorpha subsp. ruderalis]
MDPHAPAVDYSQAFARARASQLGSMPPLEDKNEESFNQSTDSNSNDHVQNVDGLPMVVFGFGGWMQMDECPSVLTSISADLIRVSRGPDDEDLIIEIFQNYGKKLKITMW